MLRGSGIDTTLYGVEIHPMQGMGEYGWKHAPKRPAGGERSGYVWSERERSDAIAYSLNSGRLRHSSAIDQGLAL